MTDSDDETSVFLDKEEEVVLYKFVVRMGPKAGAREAKITLFDDELELEDGGKKSRISYYNIASWSHSKRLWLLNCKTSKSSRIIEFYPVDKPEDLSKAMREVVGFIMDRNDIG